MNLIGLEGLKPSFGGGRPSKLTYDQLIELDKLIEKTPNMSMKDVHKLVNEKFNVNYSLKQIGKIIKKLEYNYSKAYPKFSKSPKDAEEQLKKNLEEYNITTNDIIILFDEASFQTAGSSRAPILTSETLTSSFFLACQN